MIVYLASDLVWATRIKGAGEDLGLACRPVRHADMLEARLGEGGVTGAVFDLVAEQTAIELMQQLRGHPAGGPDRVRVIAFGPHVRADLFEQAAAAGADQVLARGAFDRRLGEVLTELAAGPGQTPDS